MTPVLRRLGAADAALLEALHREAAAEFWSADTFAGVLAMPGAFGFLAASGDDPAGFALARAAADEAEIVMLAVGHAFRRRGIGARLLAAVARDARRRGCLRLFLEVAEDNEAALALYRGDGFAAVGRRKGYYPARGAPARDALVLALDLARRDGTD